MQFGMHLTLDLYNCDPNALGNMELCYTALNELPGLIHMHNLTPPIVLNAESNEDNGGKDPGGYTGVIILAESHISLHTFVRRGFVSIDTYSCNEFNANFVVNYFKKIFKSDDAEINVIKRGTRYPEQNIY